jgi:hypothetical protein
MNNADKKWSIQKNYLDDLVRQQNWQQRITWLTPFGLFRQSIDALCRTDTQSFLKYLERVRYYRETFFRYYTDKKLFESFSYFSIEPFEMLMSVEEINAIGQNNYWKTLEEKEIENQTIPFLNTDEAPRFES